jgi:hypothetical protein
VTSIDARPALLVVALLTALGLTGCTSTPVAGTLSALGSSASAGSSSIAPSAPAVSSPPSPSAAAPADSSTPQAPAVGQTVVQLQPGTSDEASGIAASTTGPGDYFLVDDGTGTNQVVAVAGDGSVVARITVDGMSASNAEALASGRCGATPLPDDSTPQNCLYVGDIGDNSARRPDIAIFRFAEPDLAAPPSHPVAADEWRYTYPDGPQNAEAMLAAADGSVLVVTKPPAKGGLPHRMYRAEPGGGELVFVREFQPPPAQRPLRTLFTGNVVTDLASSPGRVLLLTYDEVQEFTAPDPGADITTFPDWPHHRVPAPELPQAEGITSALDGCGYTLASEAGPAGKTGSLGIVTCG